VFTARYGLNPYMKQIRFVFKRLIEHLKISILKICLCFFFASDLNVLLT
jgi:hypothetical protein